MWSRKIDKKRRKNLKFKLLQSCSSSSFLFVTLHSESEEKEIAAAADELSVFSAGFGFSLYGPSSFVSSIKSGKIERERMKGEEKRRNEVKKKFYS